MSDGIVINRLVRYLSMMLLVVVMTGIYSCTSLSSDDKAVRYYTFRELGELEYLDVLEQQLCTLQACTEAYCKKLIQYKINKSLQTSSYDTTLIAEIETEVKKQTDAVAYAPVVMYLKSLGTFKSNAVAAYQLGIQAEVLFENHQDTCGLLRINTVLFMINFKTSTTEYIGDTLEVDKLKNQIYELSRVSNYPIDRMIFWSKSMYKLQESYSDALLVHKLDSILGEVQVFVNKNPKLNYSLSTLYHDAGVITEGIDQRFVKNDYALMAIQLKENPIRYITYNNYASRFSSPLKPDSLIKYTLLSMNYNNGKDLLFLARQCKMLSIVYEIMRKYPISLKYLQTYDSLTQIINKNIRQKGILEVRSKYDFQKIQTKQEELIKEKRNITFAIILISLILVLITSLLFYLKQLNDRQKAWINLKDNIISVISHDLKSPLIAMTETSKLVFDAIGKNDLHSVKHFYTSFNSTLSNMYGFTYNLLDWLTDKDHQEIKESFSDLIHNLQKSIRSYGQFKNVHVSFCDVLLDKKYAGINVAKGVEVIIRNIVSNIINHTDASCIDICSEMTDGHVYISITDDASPMDDDTYDFVMARLQSSDRASFFMSQGFGLTLVSRFMESTNSSIEIKRLEKGNVYILKANVV